MYFASRLVRSGAAVEVDFAVTWLTSRAAPTTFAGIAEAAMSPAALCKTRRRVGFERPVLKLSSPALPTFPSWSHTESVWLIHISFSHRGQYIYAGQPGKWIFSREVRRMTVPLTRVVGTKWREPHSRRRAGTLTLSLGSIRSMECFGRRPAGNRPDAINSRLDLTLLFPFPSARASCSGTAAWRPCVRASGSHSRLHSVWRLFPNALGTAGPRTSRVLAGQPA